jgi:hypothetical protein
MDSGGGWCNTEPSPEKGGEAKKSTPNMEITVHKHREKPPPKQGK